MWNRFHHWFTNSDAREALAGAHDAEQTPQTQRLLGHMRALQVRSLLDNLAMSLISTIGVAALAAWALWPYISHAQLLVWFACVVVAVTVRLLHRRQVLKGFVEDAAWLTGHLNWIRIGSLCNGLLWGMLSIAFFPKNEPMAQSLLILIITGVSAASIAVLSADRICALSIVLPAVLPMSIRLTMQPEDVGRAIGVIAIAYLFVVTGAVQRAHAYIFGHIKMSLEALERENRLRHSKAMLARQHELSTVIARAQDRFIRDTDSYALFSELLAETLQLTQSDYGLLGECQAGKLEKDLRGIAVLDRAWDEATRQTYRLQLSQGVTLPTSRELFWNALVSGKPQIVNDRTLAVDQFGVADQTGLLGSHSALRNLLVVPLILSGQRLGILVLANRSAGYDQELMDYLQPLIGTLGQILLAVRGDQQRRIAEKAAVESGERTRALIDNVIDGIVLTDAQGHIVEFNHAAERIYGYGASEVIGQHLRMLVPTNDAAYDRMIEDCIAQRDSHGTANVTRELTGARKSGERFELELSVTPTPLNGQTMFTVVVRDITEQKRARQALIDASEAADQANRAKSDFLANMSHEIRTPMNGVVGMTELLLDTQLDRLQRDYAETIRDSARSLLIVVNDVLDYSKVEAGKLELEKIDMDLRDVVEDVGRLVAMQAHAKTMATELEVTVQVDPQLPEVVIGDPGRMRQVLLNLGGNAVKFTERGSVHIELRVLACEAGQLHLRCEVRDTGIGIPEQRIDKLFKPFSQVDSSTTRRFGGSGLGLSIVRSLVELMGGEVHVESTVGKGSTFWFTARLQVGAQRASLPSLRSPLAGQSVLIVDDNETNRRVLAVQVQRCGLKAIEAESSQAALALLANAHARGEPLHAALIDQHMPGLDGAQLGAQLRNDSRFASLRLVLLSSAGRRGDARRFSELGFAAYLLKPVTQRDLADCLTLLLAHGNEVAANSNAIVTRHQLRAMRTREQQHLLLVDDNPVNLKVAKALLERMNYRVDMATNGLEALAAWEKTRYAAILMDCQMPEMDGYQATREIRKREHGREHIPIIAVTAHAMAGAMEACLAAGMDAYQSKPLDRDLLQQCLDKFLSDPSTHEADTAASSVQPVLPESERKDMSTQAKPIATADIPVDWSKIEDTAGDDTEFVQELVQTFEESSAQSIDEIAHALAGNDLPTVQKAAHSLKGASGSMGAMTARTLAANLEDAARSNNAAACALHFEALRNEIKRAEEYMHERMNAA